MYSFDTRIGFSQVDENRKLKIEAILDLFQDVTCFQGESLGVGFDYLEPMHRAWILNAWQIEVIRFPAFNEKVKVSTAPIDFKGFIGKRKFLLQDENGQVVAMAYSFWTYMNMDKMLPDRIPDKIIESYELEEALPIQFEGRKIAIPKDESAFEKTVHPKMQVGRHHLDSNHHVNNGQYVHIANAYLKDSKDYKKLRVEYRKQALLGDIMQPVSYENEDVAVVVLYDVDDCPYAVIEQKK